jgi:hypothetical protein
VRRRWPKRPKRQASSCKATETRGSGAVAPATACLRSHILQLVFLNLIPVVLQEHSEYERKKAALEVAAAQKKVKAMEAKFAVTQGGGAAQEELRIKTYGLVTAEQFKRAHEDAARYVGRLCPPGCPGWLATCVCLAGVAGCRLVSAAGLAGWWALQRKATPAHNCPIQPASAACMVWICTTYQHACYSVRPLASNTFARVR